MGIVRNLSGSRHFTTRRSNRRENHLRLFLSYAWHNNLCFPGQDRLAKDIGMSIGSVDAFIKELQACGLIDITRRGQGKTNLYTINFVVKRKPPKS
jgi:DNA-binding MarR family transcriptional regulator